MKLSDNYRMFLKKSREVGHDENLDGKLDETCERFGKNRKEQIYQRRFLNIYASQRSDSRKAKKI